LNHLISVKTLTQWPKPRLSRIRFDRRFFPVLGEDLDYPKMVVFSVMSSKY